MMYRTNDVKSKWLDRANGNRADVVAPIKTSNNKSLLSLLYVWWVSPFWLLKKNVIDYLKNWKEFRVKKPRLSGITKHGWHTHINLYYNYTNN